MRKREGGIFYVNFGSFTAYLKDKIIVMYEIARSKNDINSFNDKHGKVIHILEVNTSL